MRYVQVEVHVHAQGEVGWEVDDEGGAGRRSGGRWERRGMRKEVGVVVVKIASRKFVFVVAQVRRCTRSKALEKP